MKEFNIQSGEGEFIIHLNGDNSIYEVIYDHGQIIFQTDKFKYTIPKNVGHKFTFLQPDPNTGKRTYIADNVRSLYRDTTPTDFGLGSNLTNVEAGSSHFTEEIVIGGINESIPVVAPNGVKIYVNGNVVASGSTVENGDAVKFEIPASTEFETTTNFNLSVGDITKGVNITTMKGRNCKDLKDAGYNTSGVYTINPAGTEIQVYCDMVTDGGGWTGIINIDGDSGTNRHWSDTSFWQGNNTVGTIANFMTSNVKSSAFKEVVGFNEIMVQVHQGTTEKSRGRWSMLDAYKNVSFYDIMNLAQTSTGTKITGNRTFQSGDTGVVNNELRSGDSRAKCEFTDSFGGYELRVNWFGTGGNAKYSTNNDTVNYVRLTTGLGADEYGDLGYPHSFSGFGGHHERPSGSYVYDFDFSVYCEYCGNPPIATNNMSRPCTDGAAHRLYNLDAAIWVR